MMASERWFSTLNISLTCNIDLIQCRSQDMAGVLYAERIPWDIAGFAIFENIIN
jgi:hypothetical protein